MGEDINHFLKKLGLSKYSAVFAENEITLDDARLLSEDDLKELGLPMGPRRRFTAAFDTVSRLPAIPPDPVETSEEDEKQLDTKGERRQVTTLFADIAGFTSLSSRMDAEETHGMLNNFFAEVDAAVTRYGGAIDKHIGDAVMAVFGAPIAHTDDPERALRAAIDIHDSVKRLDPPLNVHVGVASGQVVASSTGSADHTEYTITGDSVNLAARLTDLAESGETLVSASVQLAVGRRFRGETLGERIVKGLPTAVEIWRLVELGGEPLESGQAFVGRTRELGQFLAALEHCSAKKHGQAFIVRGEAGIGKSRLVEEFTALVKPRDFAVHTGLILDFGAGKGQDAIGALVRSLLNIPSGSGKLIRKRAAQQALNAGWLQETQLVHLNDLLDLPQPPDLNSIHEGMDIETRNQGNLDALCDLIRAISETTPLFIRIEDAHWADRIILMHLAHLTRAVQNIPALLVITTRITGDQLDQTWRTVTEDAPLTTFDLSPLGESESTELAQDFPTLDQKVITACVERSGGNPLFLEQLLRNADDLKTGNIPGTIQGIVQARLDALGTEDQGAIQAAAVLGQRFIRSAIEALLKNKVFDPTNLLKNAMIRSSGNDFHFAHAMIREGVYASMLRPRLADLHRRAAKWFEQDDLVLFAEHLDKAEERGAAEAYLHAAKEELEAHRHERARRLVERALELNTQPDIRFDLTCLYGDLLRDLGQAADSITAFETALTNAETSLQICQANIGLAEGLRIRGRYKEGLNYLQVAQTAGESIDSIRHLSRIHCLKGNLYFPMGDIEKCMESHERALTFGQKAVSSELQAHALGGLADAHYLKGHMLSAGNAFERCVEIAKKDSLTRVICANLNMAALCRFYSLEFAAGREMLNESLQLSIATNNYRTEILTHQHLAFILYETGNLDKGLTEIQASLSIAEKYGVDGFIVSGLAYKSKVLRAMERKEEAAAAGEKAWKICGDINAYNFMGAWVLGAIASSSQNQDRQNWAIEEGFKLLSKGAVSHNYLWFYRDICELGLQRMDLSLTEKACAALSSYTKNEQLPLSDFYIKRALALAQFQETKDKQKAESELDDLKAQAEKLQLRTALIRIDNALEQIIG